jgi:hypothetical protein
MQAGDLVRLRPDYPPYTGGDPPKPNPEWDEGALPSLCDLAQSGALGRVTKVGLGKHTDWLMVFFDVPPNGCVGHAGPRTDFVAADA